MFESISIYFKMLTLFDKRFCFNREYKNRGQQSTDVKIEIQSNLNIARERIFDLRLFKEDSILMSIVDNSPAL